MEERECARCGDWTLTLNSHDECAACEEEDAQQEQ